MAAVVRALIALLLVASGNAQAAFTASYLYTNSWQGSGSTYASATLACQAAGVAKGYGSGWTATGGPNSGACVNGGGGSDGTNWTRGAASCPANSTLIGGSCTCTAPYEQNASNNACVDPNAALCAGLSGTETYASAPGNIAPGASSCNASGCMTTFANTLIRVKNPQGQYVTEGAATFTGGTCTYSEPTGSTQDTCPGGSSGEVNGVTVCVPYDPKSNTIETVGGSDSTTVEGSDTTSSSTSSSTTCSNGSCTTTTNVTTTVNGGTPTTKSTSTNEPQSDFCTKNPRAAQCGEGGQFTGSCQASFTCTGDAVQCATARATNDQLCKFKDVFEMDSSTRALVDSVIAGTWVENPKDDPTVKPLGTFDQTNPFGETCPGNIAVVTSMGTLTVPLANFCAQLQMMGNLLVAFTLLASTVFVIRGST